MPLSTSRPEQPSTRCAAAAQVGTSCWPGAMADTGVSTWHGTVLTAVALAVSTHAAETPAARKRAVARAMREVSEYLSNTPAVARASYVDPRIVDLFEDGITIERALGELGDGTSSGPATHGPIEEAVLRLLTTSPQARVRARRRTALAATG